MDSLTIIAIAALALVLISIGTVMLMRDTQTTTGKLGQLALTAGLVVLVGAWNQR